jgi:hypothetical protein
VLAVWIALAVFVCLLVAGAAFAVVRALRAWRALKAVSRQIGGRLEDIARSAAEIETHLDRAAAGGERVSSATARLATSRARLAVQVGALREARATVRRAVPFLGDR